MRRATLLAASLALLAASGCGPQADGSRASSSRGGALRADAARGTGSESVTPGAPGDASSRRLPRTTPVPHGASRATTGRAPRPSPAVSAPTRMTLRDPRGDVDGGPAPGWADVVGAALSSDQTRLSLSLTFATALPRRLTEDDGTLLAGFGVEADEEHPSYAFVVQGGRDGWSAEFQKDGQQAPFRGDLSVEGRTVTFTAPWTSLGGPRELEWGASMRWFGSDPQGAVLEGADRLPEDGPTSFRPT